jgi:hypothetical protein
MLGTSQEQWPLDFSQPLPNIAILALALALYYNGRQAETRKLPLTSPHPGNQASQRPISWLYGVA